MGRTAWTRIHACMCALRNPVGFFKVPNLNHVYTPGPKSSPFQLQDMDHHVYCDFKSYTEHFCDFDWNHAQRLLFTFS